jgi:hypothetical protein
MKTRATPTTKSRPVPLREDVRARPARVDRAAGVVFGVKVLGLVSDNGRKYLPAAVTKAARLYEGLAVYADHPHRPHDQRSIDDKIGWLANVRSEPDGLYADLHLLTSDARTAKVLEAAEKRPELFGLSHNAEGKGKHQGGTFVVEEITSVRSVDLVSEPATNKSLFEGITVKTLKQIIEASACKPALKTALLEMAGNAMCEDDLPMADAPVEDAGPADGRSLLAQAVAALIQSSDPADHELGMKVMKLLKPETEEPTPEDDESDDEDDGKDKSTEEGKKAKKPAKGTKGLTESACKDLCAAAGIAADADLVALMQAVGTVDGAAKALKVARGRTPAHVGGKAPRSISVNESKGKADDKVPDDPKKTAAWLNGK